MKRVMLLVVPVLAFIALILAAAPGAQAADSAMKTPDIPFVDICKKVPPTPESPGTGMAGIFLPGPKVPVPAKDEDAADPYHLLQESGLAGMRPIRYDLGCGLDPLSYGKQVNAWSDGSLQNLVLDPAYAMTAAADAIDRQAWNPSWVGSLLGRLSQRATSVIELRIVLPFLGLGLLACTVMLANAMRRGDTKYVATATAWALVICTGSAFVIAAPTLASRTTQASAASVTAALYGSENGSSPSNDVTNTTIRVVHYQGWLRRTFGSADSATAREYGPKLLATTRLTWKEAAESDPKQNNLLEYITHTGTRARYVSEKGKAFQDIASDVKRDDPDAYKFLTGEKGSAGVAWYEAGFAIAGSFFRISADLLLIMCIILLCLLGFVLLASSPYTVTPAGEAMGKGLFENAARAIGYAIVAGVGSWLFSIYTEAVMQPGWPSWWSLILMLLGTFIAWTAIRPDRKALSMLTGGRVNGGSRTLRWLMRTIMTAGVGAWAGGRAGAAAAAATQDDEPTVTTTVTDLPPSAPMPPPAAGDLPAGVSRETPGIAATSAFYDPDAGSSATPPPPPPDGAMGDDVYVNNDGYTVVDPEGNIVSEPGPTGPADGGEQ